MAVLEEAVEEKEDELELWRLTITLFSFSFYYCSLVFYSLKSPTYSLPQLHLLIPLHHFISFISYLLPYESNQIMLGTVNEAVTIRDGFIMSIGVILQRHTPHFHQSIYVVGFPFFSLPSYLYIQHISLYICKMHMPFFSSNLYIWICCHFIYSITWLCSFLSSTVPILPPRPRLLSTPVEMPLT